VIFFWRESKCKKTLAMKAAARTRESLRLSIRVELLNELAIWKLEMKLSLTSDAPLEHNQT